MVVLRPVRYHLRMTAGGRRFAGPSGETPRRAVLAAGMILAAGAAVYLNSFAGVFLYDDAITILKNPSIRSLWPPWDAMWSTFDTTSTSRPILNLTLALNYAASGLEVWSYHLLNLIVHLLAGLALFGVVRRALLTERMRERFAGASWSIALVVALVWVVHPLQTRSVTYIVQRGESLMGLFFLLTLYCAIRGSSPPHRRRWTVLAVLACALGMGTKEVMVGAPLIVLLFDVVFGGEPLREVLRRRRALYAGLAATWVILGALVAANPHGRSVGFGFAGVTPVQYAMTQFGVIAHYLRLAIWPDELCFDYAWPIARTVGEILPWAVLIAGMVAATVFALLRRSAWGFAGAWFFLILAPSSSILPIVTEVAAEHRMYLPLAAIDAAMVACVHMAGVCFRGRLLPPGPRTAMIARIATASLVTAVVATLGYLTARANTDYHSEVGMWRDVVAKRPDNHVALHSLGHALDRRDETDEAISWYRKALRANPDYPAAHNNLGSVLMEKGEIEAAIGELEEAIRLEPDYAQAHGNLGVAYAKLGKLDPAVAFLDKATRLEHNFSQADCHYNLGLTLVQRGGPGDEDRAIQAFEATIRTQLFEDAAAHYQLALLLTRKGRRSAAVRHLERALAIEPDWPEARRALEKLKEEFNSGL